MSQSYFELKKKDVYMGGLVILNVFSKINNYPLWNKLFILIVGIGIVINCITINMFTLSWNQNKVLRVTKLIFVNYYHYLFIIIIIKWEFQKLSGNDVITLGIEISIPTSPMK